MTIIIARVRLVVKLDPSVNPCNCKAVGSRNVVCSENDNGRRRF